jgi:hypothetical protein
VLGHPSRDALAHTKRDAPHDVLEAVGGRPQGEASSLGVPKMEEDGLPTSRLPDERDRLAQDHVEVEARRDGLDDPVQKPVLDFDPIVERRHGRSWYGSVGNERNRRSTQTARSIKRMPDRRRRAVISDDGTGREKKYPWPSVQP